MFQFAHPTQAPLRQAITEAYRRDEIEAVEEMLNELWRKIDGYRN